MPVPLRPLETLLRLVGELRDDTSEQRIFREFLNEELICAEHVHQYVKEALAASGDQYSRALQDIVTRAGRLLGFEIKYGRYQGVSGQPGYDGLWKSPSDQAIVLETKTTAAYAIPPNVLLGYIYDLAHQGQVQGDRCLGLYVVGRPSPGGLQALEASVRGAGPLQLRVISADGLVDLLRLKEEKQLSHEEVLKLLLPAVNVDNVLSLIRTILSEKVKEKEKKKEKEKPKAQKEFTPQKEYRLPILEALVVMGGSGEAKRVLEKVYEKMRDRLTPADHEKVPSGMSTRWRNHAAWARMEMVTKGLLKKGSPKGIWEITAEGRAYYEKEKAGGRG